MISNPFIKFCLTSTILMTSHYAHAADAFASWDTPETNEQEQVMQPAEQAITPSIDTYVMQNSEEVVNIAFDLVYKGLYGQASTLLDALSKTTYQDVAEYGKSLILAQQGHFEKAYTNLTTITPYNFTNEKIDQQKNALALLIAQEKLNENNTQQAQSWLRRFVGNTATEDDRAQFSRIYTSLQTMETPAEVERFRLGLLVPMSGPLESAGLDVYKAAQLALFDAGIKSIYIYPHDTKGRPEGAQSATEAAFEDGVQLLLGPLLAENTEITSQMARYNKVPVISFSSLKEVANKNTYLLSYLPNEQAERIAKYAADKGIKTVATLVPNTPYGQLMLDSFTQAAEKLEMTIVRSATFTPGETDHSKALDILGQIDLAEQNLLQEKALLQKEYNVLGEAMDDVSLTRYREIQTAEAQSIIDFDALFVPASPEDLPLLASQLAFYDMDSSQIDLLGTGQWQNSTLYNSRQEYTRGALFPGSGSEDALNAFSTHFEDVYGYTPNPLAILGYDAVKVVADIYNAEGGQIKNFSEAITRREGFSLTSGPIRFKNNGTPERVYNIYKLGSRSAYVVQNAPTVMPPKLPEPLNPLVKQTKSVFDFFEGWGF